MKVADMQDHKYVTHRRALPVRLDGLMRLEYRVRMNTIANGRRAGIARRGVIRVSEYR